VWKNRNSWRSFSAIGSSERRLLTTNLFIGPNASGALAGSALASAFRHPESDLTKMDRREGQGSRNLSTCQPHASTTALERKLASVATASGCRQSPGETLSSGPQQGPAPPLAGWSVHGQVEEGKGDRLGSSRGDASMALAPKNRVADQTVQRSSSLGREARPAASWPRPAPARGLYRTWAPG